MEQDEIRKACRKLYDRCGKTYRARLNTHKRLVRTGQWWDLSQATISCAMVYFSVALLADPASYPHNMELMLAGLSIAMLVVSLLVSAQSYPRRVERTFVHYRALQDLWVDLENIIDKDLKDTVTEQSYVDYLRQYRQLLDNSENHKECDYLILLRRGSRKHKSEQAPSDKSMYSEQREQLTTHKWVWSRLEYHVFPLFVPMAIVVISFVLVVIASLTN